MIEVIRPGVQSTVQDAGRRVRALGVPAGGAADGAARRLANALVGNAPESRAAGLEVTLAGPTLLFHAAALVSLCGAPFGGRCSARTARGGPCRPGGPCRCGPGTA